MNDKRRLKNVCGIAIDMPPMSADVFRTWFATYDMIRRNYVGKQSTANAIALVDYLANTMQPTCDFSIDDIKISLRMETIDDIAVGLDSIARFNQRRHVSLFDGEATLHECLQNSITISRNNNPDDDAEYESDILQESNALTEAAKASAKLIDDAGAQEYNVRADGDYAFYEGFVAAIVTRHSMTPAAIDRIENAYWYADEWQK